MGDEQRFKYLVSSKQDSLWGITVDNVGSAEIPPDYKCYPPQCGHPHDYFFRPDKGRMLDNYQFIYISHGRGTCNFHPNTSIEVNAGDMLIIPPFTWHSYWPDRKTGWHEHWIGMRGSAIENRFRNGFVSPSQRIFKIGYNEEIIEYYRRASAIADLEMPGYQQVLAGLANLIFSLALYQDTNQMFANDRNIELIEQARKQGAQNMAAIRKSVLDEKRPVIATSSTCVFTIRDEYPHLLGLDNSDIRQFTELATRFLYRLIERNEVKLVFKEDYKQKIVYHTPCHMEKLGWSVYSTSLLKMIPGVDFRMLPSQCCGIAGTYGFKSENYETSQGIGQSLFDDVGQSEADFVATDCETCKWQIEMSTFVPVMNPISILAEALDEEATMEANKEFCK